jgi:hypothetical protein
MNTFTQTSFACILGRTWQAARRLERKARGALVKQGMNATLAQGLLWVARLAPLAVVQKIM